MPKKSRQPRRKAKKYYRIRRMEEEFSSERYVKFSGNVDGEQFEKLKSDLASIDSGMVAEVHRKLRFENNYFVVIEVKGFMAGVFRDSMKVGLMHHWGWDNILKLDSQSA